jgi:proliferating cell nuclear antigen
MSTTQQQQQQQGNYKLELRTTQAVAFKLLVEALKELLIDTSIEFDDTGMKIVAVDTSHIVLVHIKLDANKFEQYYCEGKVVVGLNMMNLHKLLKTINNNNILSLFIDRDDVNHLGIRIDNSEKNTRSVYKLNLMDLDQEEISANTSEFSNVVTLPTCDFQKICRDMHYISEFMEIRSVQNQLIFSCKGEFCSQETVISCNTNSASASASAGGVGGGGVSDESSIVQGVFSLKHLVLFTKCTNLCNTMELYLKNDFPLIVKYDVSSIGSIRLVLAPQAQGM